MEIWLKEEKFQFLVPNNEALEGMKNKDLEDHLARFCQFIANRLESEEAFLKQLGHERPDSTEVIRGALYAAKNNYDRRFLASEKTLCKYLPSYKKKLQLIIDSERAKVEEIQREVLGSRE